MLGMSVSDPDGAEGGGSEEGLGLLDTKTVLSKEKVRSRFTGTVEHAVGVLSALSGVKVSGYEIHMGKTEVSEGVNPFTSGGTGCHNENVYGSYIHGIFDTKAFTEALLNSVAEQRGKSVDLSALKDQTDYKEEQYDKLAAAVREAVDIDALYTLMGVRR